MHVRHAVIRAFNLASNDFGDEGAEALAEAIATDNATLRILWLQQTGITDGGAAALARAAMTENNMLEVLHLHSNDVESPPLPRPPSTTCTRGHLLPTRTLAPC